MPTHCTWAPDPCPWLPRLLCTGYDRAYGDSTSVVAQRDEAVRSLTGEYCLRRGTYSHTLPDNLAELPGEPCMRINEITCVRWGAGGPCLEMHGPHACSALTTGHSRSAAACRQSAAPPTCVQPDAGGLQGPGTAACSLRGSVMCAAPPPLPARRTLQRMADSLESIVMEAAMKGPANPPAPTAEPGGAPPVRAASRPASASDMEPKNG